MSSLPSRVLTAPAPVDRSPDRRGAGEPYFDHILAAIILLLLSPLLLMVALAIAIFDPGPVFFRHQRVGLDGRPFGCFKFRTMVVGAEAKLQQLLDSDPESVREWRETQKLRSDPRVTPLGKFLRKTSLDELPQLFNVVRGEMSLVGPRPIVREEAERYGHLFQQYCSVKPGMTGLWQISGRSDIEYYERVILDARYVALKSVWGDFRIMVLTVPAVLSRKGSF